MASLKAKLPLFIHASTHFISIAANGSSVTKETLRQANIVSTVTDEAYTISPNVRHMIARKYEYISQHAMENSV